MESDSESLWFTLSSFIAKKEEQVIHTLIPYQRGTAWLPVTDYQPTEEELAADWSTNELGTSRKWLALTEDPASMASPGTYLQIQCDN
jgi:hypothetical protein